MERVSHYPNEILSNIECCQCVIQTDVVRSEPDMLVSVKACHRWTGTKERLDAAVDRYHCNFDDSMA